MAEIKVGDKVTTTAQYSKNGDGSDGVHLAQLIRDGTWIVSQVGYGSYSGYTVLKNDDGVVMCAVDASTCTVVNASSSTKKTDKAKDVGFWDSVKSAEDAAKISKGIEKDLKSLLDKEVKGDILKLSLRLFGAPHQFTHYCDYRTLSSGTRNQVRNDFDKIGRGFMTNVLEEAPVITFIPCKPAYLPNMKNQTGLGTALIGATKTGDLRSVAAALSDENIHDKLRYYDVKQDYVEYMKYVNLMCNAAASMLELDKIKFGKGDDTLGNYDWKNYRWTTDRWLGEMKQLAGGSDGIVGAIKTAGTGVINKLKAVWNTITGAFDYITGDATRSVADFESTSIFDNYNFLQFYCDASSGVSESGENGTGASKIEGIFDSASDLTKEIAFIGNSGGLEMEQFQEQVDKGTDAMLAKLQQTFDGSLTGLLGKLVSGASNVIKGDIMIFPEIYQNSKYSKNYTITIDLRTPYGTKLGYYLNILVPLFHLMCLAMPKQSTANTYASPFLLKAYYPGVFSCNMGIVSSIQIDKNSSGDAWSVDGFPNEVKVTLNIIDLYSDLSMTPQGDASLFIANSSLIEYICTNCGIDFVNNDQASRASQVINTLAYGQQITGMFESVEAYANTVITDTLGFVNFVGV